MRRTTTTDSHQLKFKESGSTSRMENPFPSISASLTTLGLPQELITEILIRLPVKSLLKFKCVSKSWLSLISSPQFIRSHFSTSSREGEYSNHHLLFSVDDPTGMKLCSLYSALHEAEPSKFVFDIEYPYQNPNFPPVIVGIVNGLVCLAIGPSNLFLWNPVLRKSKLFPSLTVDPELRSRFVNYGFGYDESNDDYKVVSLLRPYGGTEVVFEYEVKVYSLRADSWKRNEDLKGFLPTIYPGVYANGKIYWSACVPGASTRNKKIVSLDMMSEKYGELQQPDYEAGKYDWKLGVLGGRLFVLCDYIGMKADLWVMEETWCKMVSIPYSYVHPQTPYSHQHVLCILSNGEIVLANEFGLLVYHSKRKEYRNIELDVGSLSYFKVAGYVESLVWPYG